MTPQQTELWLEIQHRQMIALERIADTLDSLAPKSAPNIQKPIEQFKSFDWVSIGASVEKSDNYGASLISWKGQLYTRRSPVNKFEPCLWFSRCVGKNEDGSNLYERLITFKSFSKHEADPLPPKVQNQIA